MTGTIRRLAHPWGYGYIIKGQYCWFFHRMAAKEWLSLAEGDEVTFFNHGLEATHVMRVSSTPNERTVLGAALKPEVPR